VLFGQLVGADADRSPAQYFAHEVSSIPKLAGVETGEDWFGTRPELQHRLLDMLGLWPLPARTALNARVTKVVERSDFIVENLLFESRPGLYVTANLYRPAHVPEPLPAILYVCGHSRVEKDGVIYGNKTDYQHHAAWFAANGYVCLVLDTLQLGELPGVHHGLYREGRWWWQSRGYTPAGVEAWNGVRALDYLESRPEVDPSRMGVTGRSGGGATSWWLGAIDDRLAAVAPVAGITDLADHVVNAEATGTYNHGVLEGHCDCMYFCNTYRWDYDTVAALVAPKPLLIENTNADSIFPLAGVKRIHEQTARVYGWYQVPERLSLVIGEGGHVDSPELRHAAFAFFEKWLKGQQVALNDIHEPDRNVSISLLKVLDLDNTPSNCRNGQIDEHFVPIAKPPPLPSNLRDWEKSRSETLEQLHAKTFRAWPARVDALPLSVQEFPETIRAGLCFRSLEFQSQPGLRLKLWLLTPADANPKRFNLQIADANTWRERLEPLIRAFASGGENPDETRTLANLREAIGTGTTGQAWVAPIGIGQTAWPEDQDTHMRRRFYLLGQTLESARVWDVRRAILTLRSGLPALEKVVLHGEGESAEIAFWAALFEPPESTEVRLSGMFQPKDAFLNRDRLTSLQQQVALMFPRPITSKPSVAALFPWCGELGRVLGRPDWLVSGEASP
jgi:dienelactone hydrolase